MGFDSSQAFRYQTDFMLAFPSILGVKSYQINLITVLNDQVNFDDPLTNRTATSNRLTVADGYRDYAGNDGYLNPMITDLKGETLVLSSASIVDMEALLGPLVFPYNYNDFSGGLDPSVFFPDAGDNNNIQVFVQVTGFGSFGLNVHNGNFFKVKEVVLSQMSNVYYKIRLTGTSVVIPDVTVGSILPNTPVI